MVEGEEIKLATIRVKVAIGTDLFYQKKMSELWVPIVGKQYFEFSTIEKIWFCKKMKHDDKPESFKKSLLGGFVYVFKEWDRNDLKDFLFADYQDRIVPPKRRGGEHIN